MRSLLRSIPPTRTAPSCEGLGKLVEQPIGDEADVDAVQGGAEPVGDAGETAGDVAPALEHTSTTQVTGVVGDGLETQHVFAFGICLHRQAPEVDLEVGEVIARCPDHGFESRGSARPVAMRPGFGPEHGADRLYVQTRPGAVDDGFEDSLHPGPVGEEQVARYSTW